MHWSKIVILSLALGLLAKLTIAYRRRILRNRKRIKREPRLDDKYISFDATEDLGVKAEEVQTLAVEEGDIISLILMAKPGDSYSGYELLQALLAVGFRYGDMNIFHKHENEDGTGSIWFSLAQAVTPGTFDLSDVGAMKCPGLALFMELNARKNLLAIFERMMETAKQLVEDLGGDIYDARRRLLDQAHIDSLRAKINQIQM